MDVQQMRLYISQIPKYRSVEWTEKVTNMPDNQVIALYHKFKKSELNIVPSSSRLAEGYWKCDSCDLKPVCNIFENHDKTKPIVDCDGYIQMKEEEE